MRSLLAGLAIAVLIPFAASAVAGIPRESPDTGGRGHCFIRSLSCRLASASRGFLALLLWFVEKSKNVVPSEVFGARGLFSLFFR